MVNLCCIIIGWKKIYQRYENGITEMSISLLNILADYYDTSIDYIIGRTDEKKPYPKSKK